MKLITDKEVKLDRPLTYTVYEYDDLIKIWYKDNRSKASMLIDSADSHRSKVIILSTPNITHAMKMAVLFSREMDTSIYNTYYYMKVELLYLYLEYHVDPEEQKKKAISIIDSVYCDYDNPDEIVNDKWGRKLFIDFSMHGVL